MTGRLLRDEVPLMVRATSQTPTSCVYEFGSATGQDFKIVLGELKAKISADVGPRRELFPLSSRFSGLPTTSLLGHQLKQVPEHTYIDSKQADPRPCDAPDNLDDLPGQEGCCNKER